MTDRTLRFVLAADNKSFVQAVGGADAAVVKLDRDSAALVAQFARLAAAQDKAARSAGELERESRGVDEALGKVGKAAAGVVAVGVAFNWAQRAIAAADAVSTLNSRLLLVTSNQSAVDRLRNSIFEIAQATRTGVAELGGTYATLARSGNELGISQTRLLTITKAVGQAMAIGGGGAQGMQAALIQLSQGMASGTLRGEELNSVMEQTPRLAQAIADGMGVSIGQLRAMGQDGKLSAMAVMEALERSAGKLDAEFGKVKPTVAAAWTNLSNSATMFVGRVDEATGASSRFASVLQSLANGIDTVGSAIENNKMAVSVFTTAIAGTAAVGGVAMMASRLAMLGGAVTALGAVLVANPLVLGLLGVGAVAGAMYAASEKQAKSVRGLSYEIDYLTKRIKDGETVIAKDGARDGLTTQLEARVNAMRAQRTKLQQELAAAQAATLDTRVEDRRLSQGPENLFPGAKSIEEVTKYVKLRNDIVQQGYDEAVETAKAYGARISKETDPAKIAELQVQQSARLIALDKQTKKSLADYDKAQSKDGLDRARNAAAAQIEIWKGADQAVLDSRADFLDALKLAEQVGQKRRLDVIGETVDKEFEVYMARTAILERQLAEAKKKTDSDKEQIEIRNRMAAVERDFAQAQARATAATAVEADKRKKAYQQAAAAQEAEYDQDWEKERIRADASRDASTLAVTAYIKAIEDSSEALAFEATTVGMTTRQRAIAIEQHRLELQLRQQLQALDSNKDLSESTREIERGRIFTANARAMAEAATKVDLDEWRQTVGRMSSTFKDGWRQVLVHSEGAWSDFGRNLTNTFKAEVADRIYDMFLEPIALQFIASASGTLGLSNAAGAANGASGLLNMASNASSLYNWGSKAAGWMGLGGSAAATGLGLTASAGAGTTLAAASSGLGLTGGVASTGYGFAAGGGLGLSASSAGASTIGAGIGSSAAAAGSTASVGASISSALAAIPGWGWALMAAAAIAAVAGKGETRAGGQYGYAAAPGDLLNPRRGTSTTVDAAGAYFLEGPSGGDPYADQVKGTVDATVKSINEMLKALGSSAKVTGFGAGYESSEKDRGGVFSGGSLTGGIRFGESGQGDNYAGTLYETTSTQSPDAKQAMENLITDLLQVQIQALKSAPDISAGAKARLEKVDPEAMSAQAATNLLAEIQQVAALQKALSDLPFESLQKLSYEATEGLIQAAGGIDVVSAGLTSFSQNMYTEKERLAATSTALKKQFEDLGLTMPESVEGFRALFEAQNVSTEEGAKTAVALLGVNEAFKRVTAAAEAERRQTETLQIAVLRAEGKETEALAIERAREVEGLTEAQRSLQERIYGLQDEARAAEEAAATNDIQARLLRLQGKESEALAIERASEVEGMTAAQKALQERIYALEDEARAAEEVATTNDIQARLLRLQGKESEALAIERAREVEGMTAAQKTLQERIYALEDEARAAEEVATTNDIQARLLRLQGKEVEALAIERAREVQGMTAAQKALQERIYALEDERSALVRQQSETQDRMDALTEKYGDLGSVLEELDPSSKSLVDTWREGVKQAEELSNAIDEAIGAKKLTDVEKLAQTMATVRALDGAITSMGDEILNLTVGKAAKGDTKADDAARKALADREKALWDSMATAEDKGAVAAAITTATLDRIKLEGQIKEAAMRKDAEALAKVDADRREAERKALQAQIDAAERLKQLSEDIAQTIAEVSFSDLSPLSYQQQQKSAEKLFWDSLDKARAGDEEAQRNVTGNYRAYLEESQKYYGGATANYADVYMRASDALNSLGLDAGQADPDGLKAQLDAFDKLADEAKKTAEIIVDTSDLQITALEALREKIELQRDDQKRIGEGQLELLRALLKERQDASDAKKTELAIAAKDMADFKAFMKKIADALAGKTSMAELVGAAPK